MHLAPSDIIGAPVFHDGKVYVALGRDLNDGNCYGKLWWPMGRSTSPTTAANWR